MKRTAVLSVALLAVAAQGCVTAMGTKQITDRKRLEQIDEGVTTKQEVLSLLGQPSVAPICMPDREMWMYSYTRMRTRPATYIPILGLLFGGMDTESHTVQIVFDDNGVVKSLTQGGLQGGGGGVQDLSR